MKEISIMYFLRLAWKRIWALIIAAVFCASVAFCFCEFIANPAFQSTSSILVTNGAIVSTANDITNQTNTMGEDDTVKSTDITASLSLANTITDILKTSEIYKRLASELGGKYTFNTLKGMTTIARRNTDTLIIDVTIKSSVSGEEAQRITNAFSGLACDYIKEFIPYSYVKLADTAYASTQVYPRTLITVFIAGVIGAAGAFLIAFLIDSQDQTINGESEFVETYEIPLIGTVPDFENTITTGGSYNIKRGYKRGY